MDELTFYRFRNLLQTRSGLHYTEDNRADLEKGLTVAFHESGLRDLDTYFYYLEQVPTQDILWRDLIRQLTIGETYFFRDSAQFRALREHILPVLIKERVDKKLRILRIWSAGCASGEEPYSIAMLLHELIPDIDQWHIIIRATDINQPSLQQAQLGEYGSWSFRMETPHHIRDKYFTKHGERYQIVPEVKRMVYFSYLNLVEDIYPSLSTDTSSMDIILCRNVTIYFDKTTTRQIATRFHSALIEGGWLIVGHSEPMASIYTGFETHNFPSAVFYRKPAKLKPMSKPKTAPLKPLTVLPVTPKPVPVTPKVTSDKIEEVYQLMAAGKYEKAREMLGDLLDSTPHHVDALFLLAKLYADEGKLEGVHRILDTIEGLNPMIPQTHYLRALLHQQSSEWEAAKAALRRALYADRGFALAHYYMGELFYMEGNMMQARRSWENAAKLLENIPLESLVPHGDGTTVGTLLHAIEQRLNKL